MTLLTSDLRTSLDTVLRRSFWMGLLVMLLAAGASAQAPTSSATDGSTPLGLQPGAPAGSFALSGFDNVNPYNGNLNFALPLLGIGGRGGAQMTMMLKIDSKGWRVKHSQVAVPCEPSSGSGCGEDYNDVYTPEPNHWFGLVPGYGPGVLVARQSGDYPIQTCSNGGTIRNIYQRTLTRLTFTAADGTEYELRDQLTGGEPADVSDPCGTGFSRGTIFKSFDGTSATFISDAAIVDRVVNNGVTTTSVSGYLLLKDGIRYRIDGGHVTWMRDRNGNKISFTYETYGRVAAITDSLNRQVTIEYDITDVAPYGKCDRIIYKGFGGAQRIIRVSKTTLFYALRSGYALKSYKLLFPELNNAGSAPYDPSDKVSYLWLPDGRSYRFLYNSYGELAKVVLPTGGAVEYDYTAGSGAITDSVDYQIYRRVVTRRLYRDATTVEGKMTFSDPSTTIDYAAVVDHLNSGTGRLAREKHYYYGDASQSLFVDRPTNYPEWQQGREYKTEQLDTDGVTVLRRVENTYEQRAAVSWWEPNYPGAAPPNDVRLTQAVTTLLDTGTDPATGAAKPHKVSKQTYQYDQYNNQTDVYEYDYGTSAPPAQPTRHTDLTYVTTNVVNGVTYNYATDTDIHLRSLVKEQKVYAVNASTGAETLAARTINYYDQYDLQPLVARSLISGLDAGFTTTYYTRGNATRVSRWLNSPSSWLNTDQQYDVAGNVTEVTDPRGKVTNFDFTDRFGVPSDNEARTNTVPTELGTKKTYALATKVTNALGHIAYTQFDYYLGKPVNAEDSNGTIYSGYYNDDLDRPTQMVSAATETTIKSQTRFIYDDVNNTIRTTSDRSAYDDDLLKSEVDYDGLGRTIRTRSYEDATNYILVEQTYDAMGRAWKKSNPYRPLLGEPALWTQTTYDEMSRVTQVMTPANAKVNTSYSGNKVTVSDQALKDRESTTDALGRLIQVIEDPGTGGLNYQTTYGYDALDNLLNVTQGAQTRNFTYDSVKRLKSAANPESGTINYTYDAGGNLTQKKDARSITANFAYDDLNRVTSKTYSDATPDVFYYYDSQAVPTGAPTFTRGESKGRLVAVTYGGATATAGTYYGYDGLGRMIERVQQTDATNYEVNATYNRAGAMVTETYPAAAPATTRRAVTHTFDGAGRLASLSTAGASVTGIKYASHGALSQQSYGTLLHTITYDVNRLQPTSIKLIKSTDASVVPLDLTYTYGTATTNNGNITAASMKVQNPVGTVDEWTQTFTYDALNRLDIAKEVKDGGQQWSQNFDYDQYGNRCLRASNPTPCTPDINAAQNNRLDGFGYDGAGNQSSDDYHTYAYDAENHIKSVDGVAAYVYDGEGNRVRKIVGENLRMVYGITGELLSEFDGTSGALKKEYIYGANGLAATIAAGEGTRYVTADHLGSPRIITGSNGAVISRHDYQPFGEELFAGMGSRTTAQGYNSPTDSLRQKFTGKERDNETGLDYFGARYFANAQGRFTSVDPYNVNMERQYAEDDKEAETILRQYIGNPQRWNRYLYVLNNPLKYVDPTGEKEELVAQVNIIYDKNSVKDEQTARNMTAAAVADATKVFATAGITLKVTYTAGTATGKGANAGRQITEGKLEGAANIFIGIDRTQWTGGVSNAATGEAFINWGQGRAGWGPFAAYTNTSPENDVISHELGHLFGINTGSSNICIIGGVIDYATNTADDIEINGANAALRRGETTEEIGRNPRQGMRGILREIPAISKYRNGAKRFAPR